MIPKSVLTQCRTVMKNRWLSPEQIGPKLEQLSSLFVALGLKEPSAADIRAKFGKVKTIAKKYTQSSKVKGRFIDGINAAVGYPLLAFWWNLFVREAVPVLTTTTRPPAVSEDAWYDLQQRFGCGPEQPMALREWELVPVREHIWEEGHAVGLRAVKFRSKWLVFADSVKSSRWLITTIRAPFASTVTGGYVYDYGEPDDNIILEGTSTIFDFLASLQPR